MKLNATHVAPAQVPLVTPFDLWLWSLPPMPQADRDEARSQHAAALSQLEAQSQQLAEASAAKSHAQAAAEELQAEHDALTAQHTALQAQVSMVCLTAVLIGK